MEDFYSVLLGHFGYPINHKPPRVMYEAGLRALGLNWRYLLVNVRRESLPGAIAGLRAFEMRGANLTMPLKTEVIPYLDALDDSARLTGAVNTILNEEGKLTGYNTDGQGQYDAMMQAGVDPGGKRIVLLGAGGAARAIGVVNALHGAERIIVINRSRERGEAVAECIRAAGGSASFLRWEPGMALPGADIVVNATPVGLSPDTGRPDISYDSIHPGMVVSDAVMNPPRTNRWMAFRCWFARASTVWKFGPAAAPLRGRWPMRFAGAFSMEWKDKKKHECHEGCNYRL